MNEPPMKPTESTIPRYSPSPRRTALTSRHEGSRHRQTVRPARILRPPSSIPWRRRLCLRPTDQTAPQPTVTAQRVGGGGFVLRRRVGHQAACGDRRLLSPEQEASKRSHRRAFALDDLASKLLLQGKEDV